MNKISIAISSLAVAMCAGALSAEATPISTDATIGGLLGSPVAQVPIQDPVVKKAIEWIRSKHQLQPVQPESSDKTIGQKRENNRRFILGGPEIIPM